MRNESFFPYLTLMQEDAPQRGYPLRLLFNAIRAVLCYCLAVGWWNPLSDERGAFDDWPVTINRSKKHSAPGTGSFSSALCSVI